MNTGDIVLSKETANDDTALIVAIYVAGGSRVEEDELLFDAESSKATQEIRAPIGGLLAHDLAVGQEVGFGVPLGRITPLESAAAASDAGSPARPDEMAPAAPPLRTVIRSHRDDAPRPAAPPPREALPAHVQDNRPVAVLPPPPVCAVPPPAAAPRFSKAAAALIAEFGLSPSAFTSSFVTSAEVGARSHRPKPSSPAPSSPAPAPGDPVGARKRAEIDVLGGGAGGTMLSVLGVGLGRLEVRRSPGSFLEGRIVDLVIYEAARLMRRYPKLNAAYHDARVTLHPAVHAGLAIDGGGRLVVYGIADADRTSLKDLVDTISDAVSRYVDDRLTVADVTRATFTVTDLSDGELDFVLPLLPRGQSCILAITRDAAGEFRLFAGFDHRVTEGREVSSFLGDLRTRLLSFAAEDGPAAAAHCVHCDRSAAEAVGLAKDKGLLRIVDQQGRDALCCASCWNGW